MKFAFAKDSKRFSAAVEKIRREGGAMTDENIEKVYNSLGKKGADEEKTQENPQDGATAPAEGAPAPKAAKKRR